MLRVSSTPLRISISCIRGAAPGFSSFFLRFTFVRFLSRSLELSDELVMSSSLSKLCCLPLFFSGCRSSGLLDLHGLRASRCVKELFPNRGSQKGLRLSSPKGHWYLQYFDHDLSIKTYFQWLTPNPLHPQCPSIESCLYL